MACMHGVLSLLGLRWSCDNIKYAINPPKADKKGHIMINIIKKTKKMINKIQNLVLNPEVGQGLKKKWA